MIHSLVSHYPSRKAAIVRRFIKYSRVAVGALNSPAKRLNSVPAEEAAHRILPAPRLTTEGESGDWGVSRLLVRVGVDTAAACR